MKNKQNHIRYAHILAYFMHFCTQKNGSSKYAKKKKTLPFEKTHRK